MQNTVTIIISNMKPIYCILNILTPTKTTKGTTRVPEISHLRVENHSKSNEEENNGDKQACR